MQYDFYGNYINNPEDDVYFDDVRLQNLDLDVTLSSDDPMLSGTRDSTALINQMHGAYDFGACLEPKQFNLACMFHRMPWSDLKDHINKLNSLLLDEYGRPRTFKLRFGDEPDKYYTARYSGGLPIDRSSGLGQFSIPLVAFDPHKYSLTTNDEVTWGSQSITFNNRTYTYGHTGGGQAMTITQPTTYSVYVTGLVATPIIAVSGSGTNVTLSTGGKTMSLSTFTDTNWLIDLAEYTALKNGQNGIGTFGNADWLEFMPGDNQLTVGGSGLNLTVQVKFRDKFM